MRIRRIESSWLGAARYRARKRCDGPAAARSRTVATVVSRQFVRSPAHSNPSFDSFGIFIFLLQSTKSVSQPIARRRQSRRGVIAAEWSTVRSAAGRNAAGGPRYLSKLFDAAELFISSTGG